MPETPPTSPEFKDKSSKPPGVLPQYAHAKLVAALAVLMVVVIAFSSLRGPAKSPAPPPTNSSVADPNEARIREYRQRIEEQSSRLRAEQAQFLKAKESLESPPDAGRDSHGSWRDRAGGGALEGTSRSSGERALEGPSASPRERDWRKVDEEKRDYLSRYATNVAKTTRDETSERAVAGGCSGGEAPNEFQTKKAGPGDLHRVMEGTIIETALVNRLDGSFSGPVNCMVSSNVYSHDLRRLVIPQGARVLGEAKKVDSFGQQRLAIIFHRLIFPNGASVKLDLMPGLNQQGETGLRDKVNHHYLQVFGASLAIGAVAGLSQAGTRSNISAEESYRRGVSDSLSQSALRILDRYLNVLPTLTIEAGHRVKVYLTGDLELPAYGEAFKVQEVQRD